MPYKNLQDKLKEQSKKLHVQYDDKNKSIAQYISGVQCDSDSPLCVKWQQVISNKTDAGIEEILNVIQEMIQWDKEIVSKYNKEVKGLDKEISAIDEKIGKGLAISKALAQKEKAERALSQNEQDLTGFEEELKKQEKLEPERERLLFEIQKITEKLEDYDKLDCLSAELLEKQKTLEDIELQRMMLLQQDIEELEREKNLLKDLQSNYEKKNLQLIQTRAEYIHMEQIFMNEQAGIMAERLEEGIPCPVCGSIKHPSPAKITEKAPSKEEVEQAKAQVEQYQKDAEKLSGKAHEQSTKVKVIEKETILHIEKILGKITLEDAVKTLKKSFTYKSVKINSIKVQVDNGVENIDKIIENYRITIKSMEAKLEERRKNLQFDSKGKAKDYIGQRKREYKSLEKAFSKAKKQWEECKKNIDGAKQIIQTVDKQLKNAEMIPVETLKEEKAVLTVKRKRCLDMISQAGARMNINENSENEMHKQYKALKEVEEHWNMVKALSNTANGNLSGKEKILLETYVQMHYFDAIIRRANIRLMAMSCGQYELKRADSSDNLKGQSGLELNVIDHYNGSERSVKTLSGGESFKASLALALGLSEEVHAKSGGIQIDTLFVDEGFGSLDEESLNQAMNALADVTEGNRLVGIISHVREIKERIDRKIVVTKDKINGSSIALEI